MEKQTLYRRYIKRYTLHQLLAELFGNNYHVEEIEDVYCLTIPRKLTEAEITKVTENSY